MWERRPVERREVKAWREVEVEEDGGEEREDWRERRM